MYPDIAVLGWMKYSIRRGASRCAPTDVMDSTENCSIRYLFGDCVKATRSSKRQWLTSWVRAFAKSLWDAGIWEIPAINSFELTRVAA
jgi:hypothetical protein